MTQCQLFLREIVKLQNSLIIISLQIILQELPHIVKQSMQKQLYSMHHSTVS